MLEQENSVWLAPKHFICLSFNILLCGFLLLSCSSFHSIAPEVFFRRNVLPGAAYFRSPVSEVATDSAKTAESKGLPPVQADGKPWEFKHLCSAGLRKRLASFDQVRKERFGAERLDVIADLAHYVGMADVTVHVPALTSHNLPYSFEAKRPLRPLERLEVMGLPIHVPDGFLFQCPFRHSFLRQQRAGQLCEVAGNAMHVAAIGAVVLIALGMTKRAEVEHP